MLNSIFDSFGYQYRYFKGEKFYRVYLLKKAIMRFGFIYNCIRKAYLMGLQIHMYTFEKIKSILQEIYSQICLKQQEE